MKFLSLLLILFSLNGYAAKQPCRTPECREAWQKLREANGKAIEAEKRAIKRAWQNTRSAWLKFLEFNQKAIEAEKRARPRGWMTSSGRRKLREAELKFFEANQKAIESKERAIEIEQRAIEIEQRAIELSPKPRGPPSN